MRDEEIHEIGNCVHSFQSNCSPTSNELDAELLNYKKKALAVLSC